MKNETDYCLIPDSSSASAEVEAVAGGPQLPTLEAELSEMHRECANLLQQLEREQRERKRLAARYFELQARYTSLARLHVAADRLILARSRNDVYEAIQEVVANLVGSEEVGVFLFDQQECNLQLISSCGIDSELFSTVPLGSSLIGRSAANGNVFVVHDGLIPEALDSGLAHENTLSACLPLRHDGLLLGAVAIFGLLDHRRGFNAEDVELLEAIAKWASIALYCTAIQKVAIRKELI